MFSATIDSTGAVTAFYHATVNAGHIPAGAIALTDEQYATWSANQAGYVWSQGALVASQPSIDAVRAVQIAGLRHSCAKWLAAGFSSSALGSAHLYPTNIADQHNLTLAAAMAVSSGLPSNWQTPLWCADGSNVWAFLPHTAAQVAQVAADWLTYRTAAQSRLISLTGQADNASTVAAVQAVTW